MQATLPVRTYTSIWFAVLGLALATTIVIGGALAFAGMRSTPASVSGTDTQAVQQSITNHSIDERALPAAAPVPVYVKPNADDKVGSSKQADSGSSRSGTGNRFSGPR